MVDPVNIMPLEEYLERIDPLNEAEFTKMVMQEARGLEWLPYHVFDSRKTTEPGFPDLVLIHPRHGVVFAELKMPGNYPTAVQRGWLQKLVWAGQRVYVWRPKDWKVVKHVLRGGRAAGYEETMRQRDERERKRSEKRSRQP